jgi:hypothetical protein
MVSLGYIVETLPQKQNKTKTRNENKNKPNKNLPVHSIALLRAQAFPTDH